MVRAYARGMKAKNLDDVLAYRKAEAAADEVSAILKRPVFGKDLELKDQLSRSSGRVGPLIAEGFGQNTDRQMADYFGRARGSALESISKMLTPWINYLQRCNWKSRWRAS